MRSWRWWMSRSALPLWGALAFLLWSGLNALANRALRHELDLVRDAGQPLVPPQCAKPAVADEDNAAFPFLRAMAILKPSEASWDRQAFLEDWTRPSALGPRAELWVSANAPALEDLKKAAARPACRFPIDYSKGAAADAPGWLSSQRCAQLLACAARLAHERGDDGEADLLLALLLRLGVAMGEEPMLVTSMAGLSVFRAGFELCQTAFDAGLRPGPATRALLRSLRPGLFEEALVASLLLERSTLLASFLAPPVTEDALSFEHRFVRLAPFRPYLKWDLARFCRLFRGALGNARQPPASGAWRRPSSDDIERGGGWLAASLLPHFPTLASLGIEADIHLDLLRGAVDAFERVKATGRWPSGFAARDRFTGDPLRLLAAEGRLTLYSAGRDGIDNAGDPRSDIPLTLHR